MSDQNSQQEEDLYDDLNDTKPAAKGPDDPSKKRKKSSLSLTDQVDHLEKKVEQLEKENETLKRNMGTLYRTAKSEMERKDAEIERLMKQIESIK